MYTPRSRTDDIGETKAPSISNAAVGSWCWRQVHEQYLFCLMNSYYSFLYGRRQQCKINGLLSNVANIGLGIVQGSGIGPTLKSDLHTMSLN